MTTTPTPKPVLTSAEYDEITFLIANCRATARATAWGDGEDREARRDADTAAFQAVINWLIDRTAY